MIIEIVNNFLKEEKKLWSSTRLYNLTKYSRFEGFLDRWRWGNLEKKDVSSTKRRREKKFWCS